MVLPDPVGDSTTKAAAARSSDNGALVVWRKRQGFRNHHRKERNKSTQKSSNLRRHRLWLLHRLAEASRLRGRLLPPGCCRPAPGFLRPTAEQTLGGATLLPSAPSRRCSGGTRATSRCRPAARDDFGLIVVRPVVEGDSMPGAACFAAGLATTRLGVVVHSSRPQVEVLQIVLRPVRDESALRVRPACRPKKRAPSKQAD